MSTPEQRAEAKKWAERVLKNRDGYDSEHIAVAEVLLSTVHVIECDGTLEDDGPITPKWLEEIGAEYVPEGDDEEHWLLGGDEEAMLKLCDYFQGDDGIARYTPVVVTSYMEETDEECYDETTWPYMVWQRGQVRMMCRLLGILLKDEA